MPIAGDCHGTAVTGLIVCFPLPHRDCYSSTGQYGAGISYGVKWSQIRLITEVTDPTVAPKAPRNQYQMNVAAWGAASTIPYAQIVKSASYGVGMSDIYI